MLTLESLTLQSNILELTNPNNFLNTTKIPGSYYTQNSWCSYIHSLDAVKVTPQPCYFSGYVFRGDTRQPEVIFEHGFESLREPDNETTMRMMMGIGGKGAGGGGTTGKYGISTSVCASACGRYSFKPRARHPFTPRVDSGFVYLIDANGFAGFSMPTPRPDDPIVSFNPILREIYEVNFEGCILPNKIVGIVWPRGEKDDGLLNSCGFWVYSPARLWLAVNPYFEKPLLSSFSITAANPTQPDRVMKGMEAAVHVQNQFNQHY